LTEHSPTSSSSLADADAQAGILITGANGHLGQRLIPVLARQRPVTAVVRSEQAAVSLGATIAALPAATAANVSVINLDYVDVDGLRAATANCDEIIHLAGILKESPWSTYQQAHEDTTQALLEATTNGPIKRIHYLSIVGSSPDATNPCLASKGRAEEMLLSSSIPALVLQVPMVLGEGDYAAAALNAQARRGLNIVFAVNARDQPLYAGDVVNALINGSKLDNGFNERVTLAGPSAIDKRTLVKQAAGLLGNQTRVIGLPKTLALGMAKLFSLVSKNPPVTEPMMDILHHDDNYDTSSACETLQLTLTSLDDMLEHVLLRS